MLDKPLNQQAVEEYVRKHREDLLPMLPQMFTNNGMILLLTLGFEAGRTFQKDNPQFPLGQSHLYLFPEQAHATAKEGKA